MTWCLAACSVPLDSQSLIGDGAYLDLEMLETQYIFQRPSR
jgi:hypothetical protein